MRAVNHISPETNLRLAPLRPPGPQSECGSVDRISNPMCWGFGSPTAGPEVKDRRARASPRRQPSLSAPRGLQRKPPESAAPSEDNARNRLCATPHLRSCFKHWSKRLPGGRRSRRQNTRKMFEHTLFAAPAPGQTLCRYCYIRRQIPTEAFNVRFSVCGCRPCAGAVLFVQHRSNFRG